MSPLKFIVSNALMFFNFAFKASVHWSSIFENILSLFWWYNPSRLMNASVSRFKMRFRTVADAPLAVAPVLSTGSGIEVSDILSIAFLIPRGSRHSLAAYDESLRKFRLKISAWFAVPRLKIQSSSPSVFPLKTFDVGGEDD